MNHARQVEPKVVCLCGSTRFFKAFQEANYRETMGGNIVLSVGFYMHAEEEAHGEHVGTTIAQKSDLDELHLRKIDLADEVLVLNVQDYWGQSTRREAYYAALHTEGKVIRFLEPSRYTLDDIKRFYASRAEWRHAGQLAASNR